MADLLAARVPALDVRPIGSGRFTLRVRGYTTLPNAEPVVVIDGMRYLKNGAEMLASIAPREVKRIEVLRDAAAIAGFTSAASGGVVVVSTWRH
jgi:outer membrane cobalamin receptor